MQEYNFSIIDLIHLYILRKRIDCDLLSRLTEMASSKRYKCRLRNIAKPGSILPVSSRKRLRLLASLQTRPIKSVVALFVLLLQMIYTYRSSLTPLLPLQSGRVG